MTDLLRLDRLAVQDTREEDGALIITVASKAPTAPRCCLDPDHRRYGTKAIRFRDFTIQAQAVWLEVKRQRFRCDRCGAFPYEDLPDFHTDYRVTNRFLTHLEKQAVRYPFTTAAQINGVHETLIRRVFDGLATRELSDYRVKLPRVLGMDEIHLHGRARFVLGDIENSRMLDMQASRRDFDLRRYFGPMMGRADVEVVCQDMWIGYRNITKAMFPRAVTVIDKYHVQRTANYGMEFVRRATYIGMTSEERRKLKRQKHLFLTRWDDAKETSRNRLLALFVEFPFLNTAYTLKEDFYDIYRCESRAAAEQAMTRWADSVPSELVRPFKPCLDAIKNWRPHILRYFEHPYTNAYVERMNGLIRTMNVQGTGYSFATLRAKALLKYGAFDTYRIEPTKRPVGTGIAHWSAPEMDEPIDFRVFLGSDLATLGADLEAGTF